jgi:hypothetical protein
MKRFTLILATIGLLLPGLVQMKTANAQSNIDTLAPHVISLKDKIAGVEERIATAESDLAKLTKVKLSGYIQAQWLHLEAANVYPSNYFQVRRARIKIAYEPVKGIAFVLQPDFVPGNITIKDAYAVANEKWLKTFSLWAGKFNRPNYEVEYSSSSREVPERTRVIRAIYPDERAIGAKLEINPPKIPLKVQLALFNGNDGISITQPTYNYSTNKWDAPASVLQNTDYDNFKDFMGRVTYGFKFGSLGGLTVGAHGYYGKIKANSKDVLNSEYQLDKTGSVGDGIPKQWVGVEAQLYLDLLGGLALKGEYIFGVNSTPGYNLSVSGVTLPSSTVIKNDTMTVTTTTLKASNMAPAITKNFMGYYVYAIKNIGKKNQVAVRYDFYNPNTKLAPEDIGTSKFDAKVADVIVDNYTYAGTDLVVATNNRSRTTTTNKLTSGTADIPYGTWTFAYTYYFDDNIKFMIGYEIPMNKKVGVVDANGVGNVKTDYTVNGVPGTYYYNDVIKQNTLTVRMQVKF